MGELQTDSEGAAFARGITDRHFMNGLLELAARQSWWREVLEDTDLVIAIRNECLNVYWRGQSLFKVKHAGGGVVTAETHPKYLLDPCLENLVAFDGSRWRPPPYEDMIAHTFVPGKTLASLKKAATPYAGDEKKGVQEIVARRKRNSSLPCNPNVLDVEIAVPEPLPTPRKAWPRIDIAALEEDGETSRLVFWEAKLFGYHKALRAADGGRPPVLDQIGGYRRILNAHRKQILDSYGCVAANLVEIAKMSGGTRAVGSLVQKVADRPESLALPSIPEVGLIVFGFDDGQKRGEVWKPHRERLLAELPNRFLARGEAKDVRLPR